MDIKAFLAKPIKKKEEKPKEEEVPQIDAKVTEYVSGLPQQNFTLAPKQKQKTDKKPIIIAASIVGVLLLASIIAFIFWPKGGNTSHNTPAPGPDVAEEEPEDEEDEETLNTKLAQKFNTIMSYGENNTSDKVVTFKVPSDDAQIYTKLDYGNRIYIAAQSVRKEKNNVSALSLEDAKTLDDSVCNNVFKRACGNLTDEMLTSWKKIDATKVTEKYINLFGALPEETNFTYTAGCPTIFYSPEANIVASSSQCNASSSSAISIYQYKYTYSIDDRYAYVYFVAGAIKPHENSSIYDLYSDLYGAEFMRTLDEGEYKITDKNYEKFKHYRMTFYKNDHNFIYKNVIEEVEEEVEIKDEN